MLGRSTLYIVVTVLSLSISIQFVRAQSPGASQPRARQVTAFASGEQVRFTSLGELIQLRLEVINSSGEVVFDSGFKPGNVLDWSLRGTQDKRLADGSYLCQVTVKDSSGQISRRNATANFIDQSVTLKQSEPSLLTAAQADAAGIEDQDKGMAILEPHRSAATAVLAHDGSAAHLVTGSGGLSFSIGDFFANRVLEHIRLTGEGNLGIGTSYPQAKLDVAGLIRTSQGIMFPDGTIQTTAAIAAGLGKTPDQRRGGRDSNSTNQSRSTGKGGKVSNMVSPQFNVDEDLIINGNIIYTPPSPQAFRDITMQNNNGGLRFYGAQFPLTNSPAAAAIQFWGNNSAFPGQLYLDSGAHNSAALIFRTTQAGGIITERMRVTAAGNVGIGTSTPGRALHVYGTGALTTATLGTPNEYNGGFDARLHVVHGSGNWGLAITRAANDSGNANLVLYKTRNIDASIPTAVQALDDIGRITWQAPDASNTVRRVAEITVQAPDVQLNGVGGSMTFTTYTSGGNPATLNMTSFGNFYPGNDNSASLGNSSHRWLEVWAADGTINTSDARLKQDVANLRYGLQQVMNLRPVTFKWKDRKDDKVHLGLIAQEVEPIIPEAIARGTDAAAPLGMNYANLIPVVIKAIQEQQTTIAALKAERASLQQQNAMLEERLAALEQKMQNIGASKSTISRSRKVLTRSKIDSRFSGAQVTQRP